MWSGTSSVGSATMPSGNSGKSFTRSTVQGSLDPGAGGVRTFPMALVWLRRDLRVHDHPPLRAALAAHVRVVPVFVLDERLPARSPSRAAFMLDCLRELRDAMRARGGELFVRAGRPEAVLPELARETGSRAVYYAPDVSPFAVARDRAVDAALDAVGVQSHRVPGTGIARVGKPYVVFTPFWRAFPRSASTLRRCSGGSTTRSFRRGGTIRTRSTCAAGSRSS